MVLLFKDKQHLKLYFENKGRNNNVSRNLTLPDSPQSGTFFYPLRLFNPERHIFYARDLTIWYNVQQELLNAYTVCQSVHLFLTLQKRY